MTPKIISDLGKQETTPSVDGDEETHPLALRKEFRIESTAIRGFAGKLLENASRLAGVMTLIEDLAAPFITLEMLNKAISNDGIQLDFCFRNVSQKSRFIHSFLQKTK